MAHHAGIESLLGWIQRGCKEKMQQAQSWEQLHALLVTNGLHLHPRANSLVITAENSTTVKASSVGRDFSKPKLEQRFGPFQPASEQEAAQMPRRRYEKKPLELRPNTEKFYTKYQAAQAQMATFRARERELERVRAYKERRIEAAMRHVRLKRAALKLAKMPRDAKKMMYRALANALRDKISKIKRESKPEYLSISQKCHRRQWVDWLRYQAGTGNADALTALRRRRSARDGVSGTARCHVPLSDGGYKPTTWPVHAKDWGPSMLRAGFHTVNVDDLSTFKPLKGDVAVIQATTHHKSGHIQGSDGRNWISDFVQKNGFWPGKEYREEKPAYVIYRP